MLPVSEKYLNRTCEIKTPEGAVLGRGVLEGLGENSVQIKKADDFLPTLVCNTRVDLHILYPRENKTLIGKVYLSTPEMMRVTEVQNLSDYERRDFFRLNMELYARVYPVLEGNSDLNSIQPFPVKLTNLSIGGCFIETRKKMEIGDRFMLLLLLDGNKESFVCQVQRKSRRENNFNGYGCAFFDNSSHQNDLLCQFLFEQQREIIRRRREQEQT